MNSFAKEKPINRDALNMINQDIYKKQSDAIWDIANLLRGPYRPPQYRRVMIPFTVLRRLDCVLEETKNDVLGYYENLKSQKDKESKQRYDEETIEKMVNRKFNLSFFNTSKFTFQTLLGDADGLAGNLNNYIAGFSSRARKILEKFKFEEEIETLEEANRLFEIFQKISSQNLHPPLTIKEQKEIVAHIEKKLVQIDKMTAMSKQTVKYYEEYRSALITAAVTGKIDVTNIPLPQDK